MKKFILLILLFQRALVISAQEKQGFNFEKMPGWAELLNMAKVRNKSIFLNIVPRSCQECDLMDSNVFTDPEIVGLIKTHFIPVRTVSDNVVPQYHFFNLVGTAIYKSKGIKDVSTMKNLLTLTTDSGWQAIRNALFAFQNGMREYRYMPALAKTARTFLGEVELAKQVSQNYKLFYLNRLDPSKQFTRPNLDFLEENGPATLITLDDNFFAAAYNDPIRIDTVLSEGTADRWLKAVLHLRILDSFLYNNGAAKTNRPDWSNLRGILKIKYPKIHATENFLRREQMYFYRKINDWNKYSRLKSIILKHDPPKNEGMDIYLNVNNAAWDVFLNSNNRTAIKRAVKWSTFAIRTEKNLLSRLQYYDTKANLLYKLGKIKEAISLESEAIRISKALPDRDFNGQPYFIDQFILTLKKMKTEEPTWDVK
ncbi:DUF255 domain-containing protein [Pedobacter sp. PWIIR3]